MLVRRHYRKSSTTTLVERAINQDMLRASMGKSDPLRRKLEELGMDIRLKHPVTSLSPDAFNAQTVVSAIPPHSYAKLQDSSGVYAFTLKKVMKLAAETHFQKISFRVFLPRFLPEMA